VPRIVDHERRRQDIAKVVSKLVLEGGTEAVTLRRVAELCGYSTTVICHYFASKVEMLTYTQRLAWQNGLNNVVKASTAGKDLLGCLEMCLPNTPKRWEDWHCWLAFWGLSHKEKAVKAAWREGKDVSHGILAMLVRKAQEEGEFDPACDPEETALHLQIAVNGIATLVAQDREAWPARRQREVLVQHIRRLGYIPKEIGTPAAAWSAPPRGTRHAAASQTGA